MAQDSVPASTPDAALKRTDEQKACRKILIRTGLRLSQKGFLLLLGGTAMAIGAVLSGGFLRIPGVVAGALLALLSVPLISSGKRLSRSDCKLLAALDDTTLFEAVHIAKDLKGERQAMAMRFDDDSVVQVALKTDEVETLRRHLRQLGVPISDIEGASVVRSIRPALAEH